MNPVPANLPRLARVNFTAPTAAEAAAPSAGVWVTLSSAAELPTGADPQAALEVLIVPEDATGAAGWREQARLWLAGGSGEAPIRTAVRQCAVAWRYGRATIFGPAESFDFALSVVIDLQAGECVLRDLEVGVREAWGGVARDRGVAYEVKPSDQAAFAEIGGRMDSVLGLRLRFAREQGRWRNRLRAENELARDLSARLREAACWEERVDILDDQLETQEGVYELASQRIGEYRHAREGFIIEWIIVGLLALESAVILWDMLARHA